ncbi:MAG: DUF4160 domain-containing protein [Chloroflexi bacterium]|nr:DUF4160 domain-containing protein [Chloroflexota bacterium]
MPEISRFFGLIISMYHDDHLPPHFHVKYAEHRAQIHIETMEIIEGKVPNRVLASTLEWAALHRAERRANWERAQADLPPMKIEPLD